MTDSRVVLDRREGSRRIPPACESALVHGMTLTILELETQITALRDENKRLKGQVHRPGASEMVA